MKSLLTLLEDHVQPGTEVKYQISNILTKVRYSKGNILLQQGDISDKIYFVETGVLREFFIRKDTGEEYTTQIVAENTFFYSTLSFLSGAPSDRILEVVEDCTVITIKKNDLEYWCNKVYEIEHLSGLCWNRLLSERRSGKKYYGLRNPKKG